VGAMAVRMVCTHVTLTLGYNSERVTEARHLHSENERSKIYRSPTSSCCWMEKKNIKATQAYKVYFFTKRGSYELSDPLDEMMMTTTTVGCCSLFFLLCFCAPHHAPRGH